MKNTLQNKLLKFMSDKKWHSNLELSKVVGWRFGWHLFELRKKGNIFEKKGKKNWDKLYTEYFRLISKTKLWPVEIIIDWKKPLRKLSNLFWLLR